MRLPLRIGLCLLAVAFLFPVYWMIVTALSPQTEVFQRTLRVWPSRWAWENFSQAWNLFPYGRWFLNSVTISLLGACLSVLLSLLAGYGFAKYEFRGKALLFTLLIGTMMVPEQILLAPQFLLVAWSHGLDSYWSVIVPHAATAFGVFLSRQFLAGIPDELLEAARLDGASEWTIFWRVVLPLARPLAAVLFLFAVLDRWNEFVWPMVVLKDRESLTLPVGLNLLHNEHGTDWTSTMIVALATVLPILVLFAFVQRHLVRGIAREGIK